jgi:uncharacterized membrane protein
MSEAAPGVSYLSKHRLEALTDGIFAVAMTLLVIDLKIPETAQIATQEQLIAAVLHLIPKFIAWLISFFVLAIFWAGHHRLFHYVRVIDTKLTWLTIGYLACASLIPFSSALSGEYSGVLFSQIFYSVNMALLGIMSLLKSRHVHLHPALCSTPMPTSVFKGSQVRIVGLIAIAIVAVLITWALPDKGSIGNVAFMLMIVFGKISRRIEARHANKQSETNFLNT